MRPDRTVQASLFDSCFVLRKDKVLRYTDRRHEPCATSALGIRFPIAGRGTRPKRDR